LKEISCSRRICYPFKLGYRLVHTFCFLLVYTLVIVIVLNLSRQLIACLAYLLHFNTGTR